MSLDFEDRHVLITGGSKGLGLATARAFLAEGAKVTLVARTAETLAAAAAGLGAGPDRLAWVAADLRDPDAAEDAVARVEAGLVEVDILVNSAGAAKRTNAVELDPATWRAGLDAKFFPYINIQDAVLRRWRDRPRRGQNIVNIIGQGGRFPSDTHLAGGSANAALRLATVGLAKAYAHHGIRVNALHPGFTETGRIEQFLAFEIEKHGISRDEAYRRASDSMPLGRIGQPEDIANAVLFLASPRASYITGAELVVDGGQNIAL
ncbi:SDR family oxidoreductase [Sinirhodobacter populi]|uniref:SDR family oxidoreductase n=1 Tax=Paenirhodobacter populi TaxID=2306993 RepID=A0A443K4M4_9RHOB|nr:SDR family oxidoreductase [Sinirhodobacter populi]RWR27700.1 SDR family oxidoreductase [Sinirhodobacter populi]